MTVRHTGAFFRLAKNTGKPYNISRICRLLTGAEENAICVCDNLMVIQEIYAV